MTFRICLALCVVGLFALASPSQPCAADDPPEWTVTYYPLNWPRKFKLVASVFVDGDAAKRADVAYFYPVDGITSEPTKRILWKLLDSGQAYVAQPNPYGEGFVINTSGKKSPQEIIDWLKGGGGAASPIVGFVLADPIKDSPAPYQTVISWLGGTKSGSKREGER